MFLLDACGGVNEVLDRLGRWWVFLLAHPRTRHPREVRERGCKPLPKSPRAQEPQERAAAATHFYSNSQCVAAAGGHRLPPPLCKTQIFCGGAAQAGAHRRLSSLCVLSAAGVPRAAAGLRRDTQKCGGHVGSLHTHQRHALPVSAAPVHMVRCEAI